LLHDKVKNYIIGFTEIGLDLEPVRSHFAERISEEKFADLVAEALANAQTPATPASTGLSSLSSSVHSSSR
jgi:hypothetical protein